MDLGSRTTFRRARVSNALIDAGVALTGVSVGLAVWLYGVVYPMFFGTGIVSGLVMLCVGAAIEHRAK
jgi:hypothetical protein